MISTADKASCMCFVDIVGSGTLFSNVDEEKARARISELKSILREIIEKYDGDIRDEVGEEFMCCFGSAQTALDAAHEMQTIATERASGNSGNQYIGVRIGMHHGAIDFDAPSDTVFVAKRMVNHADLSQVLTTRSTRDLVMSNNRYKFKIHDAHLAEEHFTMQELLWQEIGQNQPHVMFRFGDEEIKLHEEDGEYMIGRSEKADITLPLAGVSREHLNVRYTYGWLEIYDVSTNGTLIFPDGGKEALLKRRKARLRGTGKLQFTPKGHQGQEVSISYEVVNDD